MLESLFNKKIIKKRVQDRCFPVNIGKFLRTACFKEHLQWLPLREAVQQFHTRLHPKSNNINNAP